MPDQQSRAPGPAVAVTWAAVAVCLTVVARFDIELRKAGRPDLVQLTDPGTLALVVAGLSCVFVGGGVALRRPGHPVGWLLLALGASVPVSGAATGYALVASTRELSFSGAAALVSDQVPVLWHVLLVMVLLVTPAGRLVGRFQRWLAAVTIGSGVGLCLALSMTTAPLDPPFDDLRSPLGWSAVDPVARIVRGLTLPVLLFAVVAAVADLGLRARRGTLQERRQLSWMAAAAPPALGLVLAAAVVSLFGNDLVLGLLAGSFVGIVPVAIALAVVQHQLYDVPRLIGRTTSYVLLSGLTVAVYGVVVLGAGLMLGERAGRSPEGAVVATLIAVSACWPLRHRMQDVVDRRFSRRRFTARAIVRRHAADPNPGTTVQQVLREASGDPSITVAYPVETGRWVTEEGHDIAVPGSFLLQRRGAPVAAIDWGGADPGAVIAAVDEAGPELESAQLRAALAVQLVEVRGSRARIVAAQVTERRRIERDLHDGVQQRLLALAMRLRLAQTDPAPADALAPAVEEIQALLIELRALANGLHPTLLANAGLSAALDDLAARLPVPAQLAVARARYPSGVESAAWFITCEAVANSVKHAHATTLMIAVVEHGSQLVVTIDDDGRGGADPTGTGLRGIADRAEAVGGHLNVSRLPAGGTRVQAVLPCA